MKTKLLYSSREEGVKTRVQYVHTKKTICITTGFQVERGYQGTYKGKSHYYNTYCPPDFVRHHEWYNDEDPEEGIVVISRHEHAYINQGEGVGSYF